MYANNYQFESHDDLVIPNYREDNPDLYDISEPLDQWAVEDFEFYASLINQAVE